MSYKLGECLLKHENGRCCCKCIYRLKAAISHKTGDLGLAAIHARRWACYNPDLKVVTVFTVKDRGHGLCECFIKVKKISEVSHEEKSSD